jgi:hypothetical protein
LSKQKNIDDHPLLPHQLENLQQIKASYKAACVGYSSSITELCMTGQLNISKSSLKEIRTLENPKYVAEIRKQSRQFIKERLLEIVALLSEKQRTAFVKYEKHLAPELPELFVSHATVLNNEGAEGEIVVEMEKESSEKYGFLGRETRWVLSYGGEFQLSVFDADLYRSDYMVAALMKGDFAVSLDVLPYQIDELKQVQLKVEAYNSKIGKQFEVSRKITEGIRRLASEKANVIMAALDEILLPHQTKFVQEMRVIADLRRYGVFWCLVYGELGETVKLTSEQKDEVRNIASETEDLWSDHSLKVAEKIRSDLVLSLSNEKDRDELKSFLSDSKRTVKFPVGLYAISVSSLGKVRN